MFIKKKIVSITINFIPWESHIPKSGDQLSCKRSTNGFLGLLLFIQMRQESLYDGIKSKARKILISSLKVPSMNSISPMTYR
ncbi:UNVERIFIED_CONTAM: hypothetical protein NCL1_52991 [Trichonephila clavipes]